MYLIQTAHLSFGRIRKRLEQYDEMNDNNLIVLKWIYFNFISIKTYETYDWCVEENKNNRKPENYWQIYVVNSIALQF